VLAPNACHIDLEFLAVQADNDFGWHCGLPRVLNIPVCQLALTAGSFTLLKLG
jgi:hypothetical protein